jgi:hypothetical protein
MTVTELLALKEQMKEQLSMRRWKNPRNEYVSAKLSLAQTIRALRQCLTNPLCTAFGSNIYTMNRPCKSNYSNCYVLSTTNFSILLSYKTIKKLFSYILKFIHRLASFVNNNDHHCQSFR